MPNGLAVNQVEGDFGRGDEGDWANAADVLPGGEKRLQVGDPSPPAVYG